MREERNACRVLVKNPKEENSSEHLGLHGRIILKCVLRKYDVRVDLSCSEQGQNDGLL
jgi:hypothetical protein